MAQDKFNRQCIKTMKKQQKKVNLDKNQRIVKKMLEVFRPIVLEDWGIACKEFEEECARCEAYRALSVLDRLYEINHDK